MEAGLRASFGLRVSTLAGLRTRTCSTLLGGIGILTMSGGGPNQPPVGEINPAKKPMQVENSFTTKPTQIAHRGLFAKELSTLGGSSSGWVDFAHRWLVLIRPVTLTKPCVSPQVFYGSRRLAGRGGGTAAGRGLKPSGQCSKPAGASPLAGPTAHRCGSARSRCEGRRSSGRPENRTGGADSSNVAKNQTTRMVEGR